MLIKKITFAAMLLCAASQALATDPMTTPYSYTTLGSKADIKNRGCTDSNGIRETDNKFVDEQDKGKSLCDTKKQDSELQGDTAGTFLGSSNWKVFYFDEEDHLFGGVTVGFSGDTQQAKINFANYNLDLGGSIKIPFQLYYGRDAEEATDIDAVEEANTRTILDPEAGFALKFPVYFLYQKNRKVNGKSGGFCAFGETDVKNQEETLGHCAVGADLTLNFKELQNMDGTTETAFGQTLRVGASLLFPVEEFVSKEQKGYLALAGRVVWSHTDIEDSTQLFAPVTDLEGNPIAFKDSILSSEFELKFAIYKRLALTAKWLKPLDNEDYFDDTFSLNIETKF